MFISETKNAIIKTVEGFTGGPHRTATAGRQGGRKLDDDQAAAIRYTYALGNVTMLELADRYGVTRYVIQQLIVGDTYQKASGPITHRLPRLDNATVRKIRQKYAKGNVRQVELADRYGVAVKTIRNITTGRRHADAGGPTRKPKTDKLTLDDAEQIRTQYRTDKTTYRALAKEWGVSHETVSRIVKGEMHASPAVT